MKPRVFIVEDEKIVALDLQSRLLDLGYDVAGMASSGEDAMPAVGEKRPDVVVMDVHLPKGIDGVETAARIREQFRIPVVFITAYASTDLINRISLSEPFAYILKPFEESELHAALQIALLRHKLEVELYEQKQLLATTLNSIDDGVIVTGEDGMIQFMNPVAEKLTGWPQDEAVGKDLSIVYCLSSDDTLVSRSGTTHRIAARSNLMVDSTGNWAGFVHAFTDVSDRVAARQALYQREQEYQMLMEQAADAIVIADATGRLTAVNSRACELLGYTRDELLALRLQELIDPRDLQNEPLYFEELKAGNVVNFERSLQHKNGSMVSVEISAKSLSDGRFQGILRDISERKKTEEEFNRAVRSEVMEKLLTRIKAFQHGEGASMNLNRLALFLENIDSLIGPTPAQPPDAGEWTAQRFRLAVEEFESSVSPQLLLLSSLIAVAETEPAFGGTSSSIRGASVRLRRAVRRLQASLPMLFSHIDGKGGQEHREEIRLTARDAAGALLDIKDTLRAAAATVREEFTCDAAAVVRMVTARFSDSSPSFTVVAEAAEEPTGVLMRASDLGDVLSTLAQNALEGFAGSESDRPPLLKITIVPAGGDRIQIHVEDNGPGISEEIKERVFENAVSTKGPGRGFGLGYALRCLEGCGGILRLDRTGRDGTRFVIELVKVELVNGSHPHHR